MLETRRLRTIAVDDPGDLCAPSATMESPVAGWRSRVRSRQGVPSPGQSPFEYLVAQNPRPGLRHDGPSPCREHGLPARGKLTKAALRAPSAGTDARDPRITATLSNPPDRAESCAQPGSGMEKACTWVQRQNTNSRLRMVLGPHEHFDGHGRSAQGESGKPSRSENRRLHRQQNPAKHRNRPLHALPPLGRARCLPAHVRGRIGRARHGARHDRRHHRRGSPPRRESRHAPTSRFFASRTPLSPSPSSKAGPPFRTLGLLDIVH